MNAANGKISVGQAHARVAAKTANGDVYLGQVERGAILAQTACGRIDVGIRDGVAAWLELSTSYGNVHNHLETAGRRTYLEFSSSLKARDGVER